MNKKLKISLILFVCVVLFYVFGIGLSTKGDASSTKRIIKNNAVYSQSEIYSAMKVAEKAFESENSFKGAILKKIIYDGKDGNSPAKSKKEYGYENVICLSTYIVGAPIWQSGYFVNEYRFYTINTEWHYYMAKLKNDSWKIINQGF